MRTNFTAARLEERQNGAWLCLKIQERAPVCGSSTYDTAQMSQLIDLIVQDCKDQGIKTMTPRELSALTERWGELHGG